jgi:hypothetical protein
VVSLARAAPQVALPLALELLTKGETALSWWRAPAFADLGKPYVAFRHLCRATSAQIASTRPKGQAPCRKP